jgi:zinc protease
MRKFFWLILLLTPTVFAMPPIQHWETENGAKVYFVPALELPMVDVEVTFAAGSAHDGTKHGLSTLTNGLLAEGANGRSADQIAEQFEDLGARFSNSVDRDMASVSLRSLNEEKLLQPALNLMALVLAKPDFIPTAFERIRQQMLASLEHQQQSPASIADKAFYQAVFGEHPYAHLSSGTVETVTALTREDVQAFHQHYYVASNAIIAIVGALTRTQAEQVAQTLMNSLPKGEPASALPLMHNLSEAKTVHIDFPSTQTHILIGQPGMARLDPDYFTLYVGNHVLGGSGLVSFLLKEIREKRGLAYSVYSYFNPFQVSGYFKAGLQTRNEQRAEALEVTYKTLNQFVKNGPTPKQLDTSKKNITGGFPLRIDSNGDIVGYLTVIGFYQLPLDYLQVFNDKIMAVTREMIQETFKRRLHLDKWVTVTVGPKAD